MMMGWTRRAAVIAVASLVLVACGADDGPEDPGAGGDQGTADDEDNGDATTGTGDGPSGTIRMGASFTVDDWNNLLKPNETYMAYVYEKYGVFWLEEPLHTNDVQGYRELADRIRSEGVEAFLASWFDQPLFASLPPEARFLGERLYPERREAERLGIRAVELERNIPLFSRDGTGLADLKELAHIIDLSQWSDELLETGMRNGKLNGLPVSVTGRVLFANVKTFEGAGIDVPDTWDGMIEAAAAFREKLGDNHYPFDAARYNAMLLTALYASQKTGVGFIDPETNEVAWDQDTLVEAFEFYKRLVDAGVMKSWEQHASMGNPNLHERTDWAAGEVASSYEWDSTVTQISGPFEGETPLRPFMAPKIEGAVSDGIFRKPSMMFAISAASANKEASAQILNCLLVEEEGVRLMETQRGIPVSRVAMELLEAEGLLNANVKAANDLVLAADAPAASPYFEDPSVRTAYEGALEEFAYGLVSAEDAASEIIRRVNQALARAQ
jgi:oligogalacturonide transport system substrate-binding protein